MWGKSAPHHAPQVLEKIKMCYIDKNLTIQGVVMSKTHSYALVDIDRAKIGFCICIFATLLSSILFSIISWFSDFFIGTNNQVIVIPLSVGTMYCIIFFIFDRWLWKGYRFKKYLKVPDLSGTWQCHGVSVKSAEILSSAGEDEETSRIYEWVAIIKISQSWNKLLVSLETKDSISNSVMASLAIAETEIHDHELSYGYLNEPNSTAPKDMKKHDGFCQLRFSSDLTSAKGTYFTNSRDRISHGTMSLSKINAREGI